MDLNMISPEIKSSTTLGTIMKLDGIHYLVWAQSMRYYIASHEKEHHLESPPPTSDPVYDSWCQFNLAVLTILLHNIGRNIASIVMFLNPAKAVRDSVATCHPLCSSVEYLSYLWVVQRTIHSNALIKGKWDELNRYQPSSIEFVRNSPAAPRICSGQIPL